MLRKTGSVNIWSQLIKAIESAYGPSIYEDSSYAPFKLTQEDSLTQYYPTFIALANRVAGVSASALLSCFISGLKREIQRDVIPWQLDSLPKAVTLARLFEEKYSTVSKGAFKHSNFAPDISLIANSTIPIQGASITP